MKYVRKILCAVLCMVMLLCAVPFSSVVKANDKAAVPVIYIRGRGTELFDYVGTDEQKQIYPIEYSDDYITNKVTEIVPVLARAIVTQDYTEYCDFLYESVAPLYSEIKLDENGDARNSSGISWSWPNTALRNRVDADGNYDMFSYVFRYDWRLDPCEVADSMNEYVKAVKSATGSEKVSIVCRCYATGLVSAYLVEYGHDDVETVVYYNPTVNGVSTLGEIFSGKMSVDSDAVERYALENLEAGTVNDFLKATISLLNADYKLDLTASAVENIYKKVKDNVLPRLLIDTYANMPAYWSMVGDADYEDAKDLIFDGKQEQYAGLIAKLDNYHYNVQLKLTETLTRYMTEGMRFALITKYGFQAVPVTDTVSTLTDNTITLESQSFGATCSAINGTLDESYIARVSSAGKGAYISPDKQIDASIGAFADCTWYIKYLNHNDFPDSANDLLLSAVRADGQLTVNDDGAFPQFLVYDTENDELLPQTAENAGAVTDNIGFFSAIVRFFKTFIALIREYFAGSLTVSF